MEDLSGEVIYRKSSWKISQRSVQITLYKPGILLGDLRSFVMHQMNSVMNLSANHCFNNIVCSAKRWWGPSYSGTDNRVRSRRRSVIWHILTTVSSMILITGWSPYIYMTKPGIQKVFPLNFRRYHLPEKRDCERWSSIGWVKNCHVITDKLDLINTVRTQ